MQTPQIPPDIQILAETEHENSWAFTVRIHQSEADPVELQLRLAWADYNHWSPSGSTPPATIAALALNLLIHSDHPWQLHTTIDCSTIRRLIPDADRRIIQAAM